MRATIAARALHGRTLAVWWLGVSLAIVQCAAPALANPGARSVSARLAMPHNGPLQPARLATDPGVDPRPFARPASESGFDGDGVAPTRRSCVGCCRLASRPVAAAPRPAASREGAVWRVGFGWRAPPCGP